ncbi:MAG: gfo/Idh/MocA family oxidoreductase, partial [Armatimonadota bacterium]
VLLQHDVVTPRPYTRLNLVQGTRGAISDYPPRIHVDGRTAGHDWESLEAYKEFEDALWTRAGTSAQAQGGHGGMDYLMLLDLVETLQRGGVPRIDVYDAAAWSAPFELSERSVASGNLPVDFPDFTRGRWGAA